ncbi:hypothetical protein [Dictyobacter formicarum]|uniref:Transposase TnpC homeodomain domain-containing protein n=1 Tax=Dictyobacter formicarum TaxID=2778368 RepID=A0ABQ3VED1_9CHLR|nr:hypothetical protein [Dictyobacter formicarum]GHO84178.1 hypothetical protein KSZ_21840 [Dictyobacter formicarum]
MGVERAVTRWYIQRQLIMYELARLEAQLEQLGQTHAESDAAAPQSSPAEGEESSPEELLQKVAMTREKLKALGHCPKPMMG